MIKALREATLKDLIDNSEEGITTEDTYNIAGMLLDRFKVIEDLLDN